MSEEKDERGCDVFFWLYAVLVIQADVCQKCTDLKKVGSEMETYDATRSSVERTQMSFSQKLNYSSVMENRRFWVVFFPCGSGMCLLENQLISPENQTLHYYPQQKENIPLFCKNNCCLPSVRRGNALVVIEIVCLSTQSEPQSHKTRTLNWLFPGGFLWGWCSRQKDLNYCPDSSSWPTHIFNASSAHALLSFYFPQQYKRTL